MKKKKIDLYFLKKTKDKINLNKIMNILTFTIFNCES